MGGVRPNAKENGQIRPSTTVRTASGGGSRPSREPPLAKHRIFVKISASLEVIRGIPDQSFHAHSASWCTPPDRKSRAGDRRSRWLGPARYGVATIATHRFNHHHHHGSAYARARRGRYSELEQFASRGARSPLQRGRRVSGRVHKIAACRLPA